MLVGLMRSSPVMVMMMGTRTPCPAPCAPSPARGAGKLGEHLRREALRELKKNPGGRRRRRAAQQPRGLSAPGPAEVPRLQPLLPRPWLTLAPLQESSSSSSHPQAAEGGGALTRVTTPREVPPARCYVQNPAEDCHHLSAITTTAASPPHPATNATIHHLSQQDL